MRGLSERKSSLISLQHAMAIGAGTSSQHGHDRVLRVIIQQLDELQEDRAGLAFSQDVRNHDYTLSVRDGDAAAESVMFEELSSAENMLRVLERNRIKSHSNRRFGVAPHRSWTGQ